MAKQDVLDAINATIVPNNIKGITAESLNNVLTMMTENAGEGGSGDGALRVIVPDMMLFGPEFLSMGELSPVSWEEMKSLLEQVGGDPSEYDAVVKASFEHNANVVQQILEKGKAGQGVSVVLDQTPYFPASINTLLQLDPQMAEVVEEFAMYAVQPAALFMQYMNTTPESEAMMGGDVFDCVLAPAGYIDFDGMDTTYPSNMLILLNLDGSLTFTPIEEEEPSSGSGEGALKVWINEANTPEQIAENVSTYEALVKDASKSVILMNAEETMTASFSPVATFVVNESTPMVQFGFIPSSVDGVVALTTCSLSADGSIVVD